MKKHYLWSLDTVMTNTMHAIGSVFIINLLVWTFQPVNLRTSLMQ